MVTPRWADFHATMGTEEDGNDMIVALSPRLNEVTRYEYQQKQFLRSEE